MECPKNSHKGRGLLAAKEAHEKKEWAKLLKGIRIAGIVITLMEVSNIRWEESKTSIKLMIN